jgi:hypothetical protein
LPVLRLLGTVAAVTSDDLTTEQAKQMGVVVGRHLNYLGRLQKRMQRVGFPHDDQLVVAVNKAFDATHALNVRLHYLGVASGVGSPPRGDRRDTPVQ